MNKAVIFGLGAIVGAAGGSVATYFATKEMFAMQAAEEIERYAEHCEERIAKIKDTEDKWVEENMNESEFIPLTNDPNEDAINSNEGVKKYHHNDGISSKYGDNNIFTTKQSEKEKAEIKKVTKPEKIQKLIDEITEEEFLDQEGNEKQTLDIFLGDDEYIAAIWGYETDNEEDVEKRFGMTLGELIGEQNAKFDNLLSLVNPDEGIGQLYLRNNSLLMDVEIVIHDGREDDK